MDGPYYLLRDERQEGPFTLEQLRALWRTNALHLGTRYWTEGMPEWSVLADIVGQLEPPSAPPTLGVPMPADGPPPLPPEPSPKSQVVFIALAVTVGPLGIHNFYIGNTRRALTQLAITLLIGWTIIPLVAMGLWNFYEAVTVRADPQGRPLRA